MICSLLSSLIQVSLLANSGQLSHNLIVNGDFTAGDGGFRSGYTKDRDLFPVGTWIVGKNPHDYHPGGASFSDHTTGDGLMLICNGAMKPNVTVWWQQIKVRKHTTYAFTGWAASWGIKPGDSFDPSPARLVMSVNGENLRPKMTLRKGDGEWSRFTVYWTSGNRTTASLRIVDENTDWFGNDFAIDDLRFSKR